MPAHSDSWGLCCFLCPGCLPPVSQPWGSHSTSDSDSASCKCTLWDTGGGSNIWIPTHPHGRPWWSSQLLTSSWSAAGCGGIWGIYQWMEGLLSLLCCLSVNENKWGLKKCPSGCMYKMGVKALNELNVWIWSHFRDTSKSEILLGFLFCPGY